MVVFSFLFKHTDSYANMSGPTEKTPSVAEEHSDKSPVPDFVNLSDWEPPRQPVFPSIRLGKYWFNLLGLSRFQ